MCVLQSDIDAAASLSTSIGPYCYGGTWVTIPITAHSCCSTAVMMYHALWSTHGRHLHPAAYGTWDLCLITRLLLENIFNAPSTACADQLLFQIVGGRLHIEFKTSNWNDRQMPDGSKQRYDGWFPGNEGPGAGFRPLVLGVCVLRLRAGSRCWAPCHLLRSHCPADGARIGWACIRLWTRDAALSCRACCCEGTGAVRAVHAAGCASRLPGPGELPAQMQALHAGCVRFTAVPAL
jgi:hypothetical protein